jgi:phosphoserine aminotransferase
MKKHNFYAGPAILPESVKKAASEAAYDYKGTGLSLMEVSHRGDDFVEILDNTEKYVRKLLKVSDDYAVLFLTGGASSQFYMTAFNLYNPDDKVGYVDTGTWSTKAIKEASAFADIETLASSKDKNFSYIPRGYKIPKDLKYLHLTSNNTIYGTQTKEWAKTSAPIICDMSSDIFSRELPLKKFGLIYAGAQKNVGLAGVTLVIVKKELLGKTEWHIPTMLDYRTHIAKNSSFNTPPVFSIYVTMLNLEWVLEQGGVKAMEKRNTAKAKLLYDEIDNNPLFVGTVAKEDRSPMNVTFLLKDNTKDAAFIKKCTEAGIVGIKGHRSVGGFRASMYNAMDISSTQVLVDVMKAFK